MCSPVKKASTLTEISLVFRIKFASGIHLLLPVLAFLEHVLDGGLVEGLVGGATACMIREPSQHPSLEF